MFDHLSEELVGEHYEGRCAAGAGEQCHLVRGRSGRGKLFVRSPEPVAVRHSEPKPGRRLGILPVHGQGGHEQPLGLFAPSSDRAVLAAAGLQPEGSHEFGKRVAEAQLPRAGPDRLGAHPGQQQPGNGAKGQAQRSRLTVLIGHHARLDS